MCGILWAGFLSSLLGHIVGLGILGLLERLTVTVLASSTISWVLYYCRRLSTRVFPWRQHLNEPAVLTAGHAYDSSWASKRPTL